jgi:hypothetical protein
MNPAVGAVLRPDDRPHRLGKLAMDVAPEHPVLVVLVVQFGRLLNKIGVHGKGDVKERADVVLWRKQRYYRWLVRSFVTSARARTERNLPIPPPCGPRLL